MTSKLDLLKIYQGGDYDSDFEEDPEKKQREIKRNDLATKPRLVVPKPSRSDFIEKYSREEGKAQRFHFLGLDAYGKHKKLINDYILYYPGATSLFKRNICRTKTDHDIIQENHQFLWKEDDDAESTWEKRLAKKYYDKLFKEYCIADLTHYKENKIGMRWRIEKEVIDGKGQFTCGNKKCFESEGLLRTWEVNFSYEEEGQKKNALVKLRLCPDCSFKLNYHHKKREVKRKRKIEKQMDNLNVKKSKISNEVIQSTVEVSEQQLGNKLLSQDDSDNDDDAIWSKPVQVSEDKSRDEEFEEYLEDLFL